MADPVCALCGRTADIPHPPGWVIHDHDLWVCDRCRLHIDLDLY